MNVMKKVKRDKKRQKRGFTSKGYKRGESVCDKMNRKFYKEIRRNNLRPSYHQRAKDAMRV